MRFAASLGGMLALFCLQATATAQLYPGYNPCQQCLQPVAQTCYRTVPVTEYRAVKQIVQRPVVETKWVDQTVTAYRPVTETKTATIPTVSYHNVTECQTVQRNVGHWQTTSYVNPKISPCQYDSRPNLFGWLNRTGYSIRQTFTPRVVTRRQYVQQLVTQNIPVTRRVATHGTRQVSYQVTRMVPYTTTRKVAVNTVRYVSTEVTTMRPVTVMRSVPIGTATAFLPLGIGTATALQPVPESVGTAGAGSVVPRRTAESDSDTAPAERFKRPDEDIDGFGAQLESTVPVRNASFTIPTRTTTRPIASPQVRNDGRYEGYRPIGQSHRGSKFPSIIRVGRGRSSRQQSSAGPAIPLPTVSLADNR
jgi:hypothetical protein